MEQNKEIAVGLHKGHKTTKIVRKPKPSSSKGVSCLHVKFLVLNGLDYFISFPSIFISNSGYRSVKS